MEEMQINHGDIKQDLLPRIAVKDPVTHSTWEDGKFTSYLICIKTNHPAFHLPMSAVRRRYSELVWLAKTLKSNHHYVHFPTMPPKTMLAERFDPAFIQERMKLIENYLNELLITDTILSDAAFHLFLQTDLTKEEMEEYFDRRLSEEFVESAWKNVGHVHTNPYVVNINTVPCEPQEIVMNEEDLRHNSRRISHSSVSFSENGNISFGAFANQQSDFSEQIVKAEIVPANKAVSETSSKPLSLSESEHSNLVDSSKFESLSHTLDTMKLTKKQVFSEPQSSPYPGQNQQMSPQQMGQYPPPAYAPPPYSSNPPPVQASQYQSQYMYNTEKQVFSEPQSSPYPGQNQQMSPQQMGQYPPHAYAPPPYSSNPPPVQASQYQSQYMYNTGNMMNPGPPPPYSYQQQSYSVGYPTQGGYTYQHTQNVIATAQFDSGARFDGIVTQHIPPPPPGCAPNAAQMAVAQGGTVVATQKKAGWFTGGSGGGVSFW